jgi:hypothetical protein
MSESDTARTDDTFAPENIGILQFIMLARIYDLLMIDLNETRPEVANKVLEAHRKGAILGSAPVLSGQFLESERVSEESDTAEAEPE